MRYLNLLLFAGMVVMNYLANALPLNGRTTGEISDSYPNLFVPAGITFSIWGVIYLMLLIFCVIQFTTPHQQVISGFGWLFGLSCLFNAFWIVAWHFERLPLSIILMLGLLVTLGWINYITKGLPFGFIKAAFGIYLGWICIATIANVTVLLVSSGWNGAGISGQAWAIIMIAVGAAVACMAIWRMENPYIGLSVVWAFAGIMIRRQSDHRAVMIAASLAALAVAAALTVTFLRKRAGLA
jgi:hypothetical protein